MNYTHVDEVFLTGLVRELAGDVPACVRFVRDFASAWEERIARILDALDRGDADDAMAALLSLYSSSAMIGARILSTAAKELHTEIRMTRHVPRGGVGRLAILGAESCRELLHIARSWEQQIGASASAAQSPVSAVNR